MKNKKRFIKLLCLMLLTSCDVSIITSINNSSPSTSENSISLDNNSSLESSFDSSITDFSSDVHSYEDDYCDSLSIHFLELGNKYVGDSVYIKAGQNDILIDAGSRKDSSKTLINYIDKYCEDGVLEYVIATHAHQDHIAGFVGTTSSPGIFSSYEIETLIDFPRTNSTTQIYNSYKSCRNDLIEAGTKHYTALDCYNNLNGAQRVYNLGENLTLSILYQKYYDTKSSEENNYSVCVLISQNNNHFLFTGDLEASGEESLVLSNKLPHVKVFKGGHHGSGTSNSDTLLNVITPENVCICTCAGTPEYTTNTLNQFPYQETINRFAKHTENIYVTSQIDLDKSNGSDYYVKSMNGNIVVTSTYDSFNINCSNNNTILKDTDWFKQYRTWPSL